MKKLTLGKVNGMICSRIDRLPEGSPVTHRLASVTFATHYSEPGYDDPESGIIAFGNWNSVQRYDQKSRKFVEDPHNRAWESLAKALERVGVELEWEDEWSTCGACGGAVRTSPDGYDWTPSYIDSDGERTCIECVRENPGDHLDYYVGDPKRAITSGMIDPKDHGFTKIIGDLEAGFHDGQDADPEVISKGLRKLGVERFLFTIDSNGQFDIEFSVWVADDELHKAKAALQSADLGKDPSPGTPGVLVSHINLTDGSVTNEKLTHEQFVNGVK